MIKPEPEVQVAKLEVDDQSVKSGDNKIKVE